MASAVSNNNTNIITNAKNSMFGSETSSQHSSEIIDYYKNKTIFITGATGFLGKVLIEKLLRSCYNLNKIYVLVRSKKGASANQRLDEIFNCKVNIMLFLFEFVVEFRSKFCLFKFKKLFETVSQYYPDFRSKVAAIQGDLVEPNMGISDEDEQILIKSVNIVFHSAATVRFDEPLK